VAAAVAVLDDFRCLELVRNGSKKVTRTWLRQDKGHRAEWEAFSCAIRKRRRITDTIFRDRGDHARYVARGANRDPPASLSILVLKASIFSSGRFPHADSRPQYVPCGRLGRIIQDGEVIIAVAECARIASSTKLDSLRSQSKLAAMPPAQKSKTLIMSQTGRDSDATLSRKIQYALRTQTRSSSQNERSNRSRGGSRLPQDPLDELDGFAWSGR